MRETQSMGEAMAKVSLAADNDLRALAARLDSGDLTATHRGHAVRAINELLELRRAMKSRMGNSGHMMAAAFGAMQAAGELADKVAVVGKKGSAVEVSDAIRATLADIPMQDIPGNALFNENIRMRGMLVLARKQFQFYECQHKAKGTPEATDKAVVNHLFAFAISMTLGLRHNLRGPDDDNIDGFAEAMRMKMRAGAAKGRRAWQEASPSYLRAWMLECIAKGDPVDVANFCMMLWHMQAQTNEASPDAAG